MVANRIRVAKDKAELVQSLLESNNSNSPFQTYADVLAFAAALGARYNKRAVLEAVAAKEPAPIALEIFVSRGYDLLIKLLAIAAQADPHILSVRDPIAEEQRVLIFEEYANGGLEVLRDELRGAVEFSERLLLILNRERFHSERSPEEFNLSRFL